MSVYVKERPLEYVGAQEPLMDDFAAVMIAEGEWELSGFAEDEVVYYEALQHLINNGMAWSLCGRIARDAERAIEEGFCGDPR